MKLKGATSIGRCYTDMHNPDGEVCSNQNPGLPDCKDKFKWAVFGGRYN